ncbi:hypothetical protein BJ741DRAFT_594310 [Chytriomyces cf. hyalinus JEL632]|nr:hypothetical protein BJ741DRAFT_594310 [Chytriomyces cf. hyalinus JEL632]
MRRILRHHFGILYVSIKLIHVVFFAVVASLESSHQKLPAPLVFAPVLRYSNSLKSDSKLRTHRINAVIATLAVFTFSGLMHEFNAVNALLGVWPHGDNMHFFPMNGLLCVRQGVFQGWTGYGRKWGRSAKWRCLGWMGESHIPCCCLLSTRRNHPSDHVTSFEHESLLYRALHKSHPAQVFVSQRRCNLLYTELM